MLRPGPFHCLALALFASSAAGQPASSPPPPVLLDAVHVLGSRLHDAEPDAFAPVTIYDRDFIAATGALRLADLLGSLPQNYTGGSAGRGSAPNDFNPEFGVRTETRQPLLDFVLGGSATPLGQTGVSAANLRGLGSNSTLMLIDGRRQPIAGQGNRAMDTRAGFVDLNAIPLGMVERVEVLADGASALYGSDAVGGVVNVVLRKNYTGAELTTDYRGAAAGGGREWHATLSGGLSLLAGRLRVSVLLDGYQRDKLDASQRDFSAQQDHRSRIVGRAADGTPIFGRDFRLLWGYPAVVQARTGDLNGITAANGAPVRVALVPEGARTTPRADQFVPVQTIVPPATTVTASGQRRANTAEFLSLVTPQTSRSARLAGEYDVRPGLRAYASYHYSEVESRFDGQPPVSVASATSGFGNFSSLVPALIGGQPNAFNPFGQDVIVGLIHAEFGPVQQSTRTTTDAAVAGLTGVVADRWIWDASVATTRQRFTQQNRTLDPSRFAAALAAPDVAQRFNPFVDARVAGAVNAAAYARMAQTNRVDGRSDLTSLALTADGPVRSLPAGEMRLAVGGELDDADHRTASTPANQTATSAVASRVSYAAFGELFVPLVAPRQTRSWAHRLDAQIAGRYERQGGAGNTANPKLALAWSPVEPLRLRASYALGFRAPSLTELELPIETYPTDVDDPLRPGRPSSTVLVTSGARPDARPETSRHASVGATLAPRFPPGLTVGADYFRTEQHDVLQALDFATLERFLPERITRATPTAEDIARGQPGAVLAYDATLANFGLMRSESLDLRLDYVRQTARGRLRLNLAATRTLAAEVQLGGAAPVSRLGDTAAPPRWGGTAMARWDWKSWHGSALVRYLGAFTSNVAGNANATGPIPAWSTLDVRAGYTFERDVWRGWGKGTAISLGVGNVFDRAPPFADTIFGFNGALHSPLGRTYQLSLRVGF